jgi:gamma-glutamylcyclotransferase (GGCT)/AIG2-like uncharacterized protein YtfP
MIIGMPLLFSYGTLRDPAVQRATFGRELAGRDDALPGFAVRLLEITDPAVLAVSGETHHPIVVATGDDADRVPGAVFELTDEELVAVDGYEVDDYHRILVSLASGMRAWVYVSAAA